MVTASASRSVDLGFISQVESYQKTLKIIFTASLLGVRHLGDVVENKPATSLVVSLGKALNGTPPPLCGRQVAQFSLQKEGCWQERYPTAKQMPCYKNADYLLWRPLIGKTERNRKKKLLCTKRPLGTDVSLLPLYNKVHVRIFLKLFVNSFLIHEI